MKALKLAICAATASLALGGAAHAQDVSFNVGVVSDYVFRGASQTDENPALQGGIDFSSGIFYAGTWASNVDFGDETSAEVDLYAGVKPTAGPVSLDFGVLYYGYINDDGDWAQWEFKAAASVPAGPLTLGAAAYYTPDYTGVGTDEGLYIEANASFSPAEKWTVSGAVGNQSVEFTGGGSDDYTTWNIGVAYAITENFAVDVRWHDTDIDGAYLYDGRATVGLKATF